VRGRGAADDAEARGGAHADNAEGRLADRTDSWITPIGKHFVRNHCAVPVIDY
jgi:hypothetical protein